MQFGVQQRACTIGRQGDVSLVIIAFAGALKEECMVSVVQMICWCVCVTIMATAVACGPMCHGNSSNW
jgi:hypothetical protein